MNKYCIYRHIRLDNNKVFYIGIGLIKRSKSKYNRNNHWKNITNKTEYEIQILKSNLLWEEACELEKILISYYGRLNNNTGILCNLTDGGEGSLNRIISENTRYKLGNGSRGNKWWLGRNHTVETKLKISNSRKGVVQNNTTKKVIDLSTNIIYNSCSELAKYLNISPSTLTYHLSKTKNKYNVKYYE